MRASSRVARWLFPYGSIRRVLRGPGRGLRFVVQPGIGVSYALGLDNGIARFLASRVPVGATVYDLGANRGQMALLFATMVGDAGRVVAFEPVEALADALRQNARLNGFETIEVVARAVSSSGGTSSFEFNSARDTQGKLVEVEPSYRVPGAEVSEVKVVTLDEVVAAGGPPPDVVKIDVEGAAGAVLAGGVELISRFRPDIYLELHGPEEQRGVKDLISRHGYVARTLDGEVVPDPTDGWFSPLWCSR